MDRTDTARWHHMQSVDDGVEKDPGDLVAPEEDTSPLGRLVAQWQRERPDLDPAPMRTFGLIARAHALCTEFLNRLLAENGLNRGTFDVLSALRRAGRPYRLTPKQLSESLMLSGAGMTSRLDRLESKALISRRPDADDRRSLQIELTKEGVKLIDSILPRFLAGQHAIADQLGQMEAGELNRLLTNLSEALEHSMN
ncbi:TPA: MarR family transcriptional regulator [Legionella pneumophila]|nr:MarR family transcriptional regulator [Legionella pneumophila]